MALLSPNQQLAEQQASVVVAIRWGRQKERSAAEKCPDGLTRFEPAPNLPVDQVVHQELAAWKASGWSFILLGQRRAMSLDQCTAGPVSLSEHIYEPAISSSGPVALDRAGSRS